MSTMQPAKIFLGIALILAIVAITVLSARNVAVPPILSEIAIMTGSALAGLGTPQPQKQSVQEVTDVKVE